MTEVSPDAYGANEPPVTEIPYQHPSIPKLHLRGLKNTAPRVRFADEPHVVGKQEKDHLALPYVDESEGKEEPYVGIYEEMEQWKMESLDSGMEFESLIPEDAVAYRRKKDWLRLYRCCTACSRMDGAQKVVFFSSFVFFISALNIFVITIFVSSNTVVHLMKWLLFGFSMVSLFFGIALGRVGKTGAYRGHNYTLLANVVRKFRKKWTKKVSVSKSEEPEEDVEPTTIPAVEMVDLEEGKNNEHDDKYSSKTDWSGNAKENEKYSSKTDWNRNVNEENEKYISITDWKRNPNE